MLDTELEFADGVFVVPEYLATLMGGMDTTAYRYKDAVAAVNSGLVSQYLGKIQQDTVRGHFEKGRRDERTG